MCCIVCLTKIIVKMRNGETGNFRRKRGIILVRRRLIDNDTRSTLFAHEVFFTG